MTFVLSGNSFILRDRGKFIDCFVNSTKKGFDMNFYISIFLTAILVSCTSAPKRFVASQQEGSQGESRDHVDEEAEKLFNNLKQRAEDINVSQVQEDTLDTLEKAQDMGSQVWHSRMSNALKISTLTHVLDALDGALAMVEGEKVSGEQGVAMVTIPVSALITMTWYSRVINHRIPILSKWKRGVKALGKRALPSRIPRFIARQGLMWLVAFPITETLLNKLGGLFVEVEREDVEELKSSIESEIEDLEKQLREPTHE